VGLLDTSVAVVPADLLRGFYRHGSGRMFRVARTMTLRLHTFQDLLETLFLPAAQDVSAVERSAHSSWRASASLVRRTAVRIGDFWTQFANLALVAAIGSRLTGRRRRGILWRPSSGS